MPFLEAPSISTVMKIGLDGLFLVPATHSPWMSLVLRVRELSRYGLGYRSTLAPAPNERVLL